MPSLPSPSEAAQPPETSDIPVPSAGDKIKRAMRDYRILEFISALVMFLLALFFALIQVHQRDIPKIEMRLNATTSVWALDPTINAEEKAQQVPMLSLLIVGGGVPIAINLLLNYVLPRFRDLPVVAHDVRDFHLTLLLSASMATLLTQFTKNMTGRFRPCFYDMCGWQHNIVWDGITNLCTDPAGEKEARKSFPSGHASFAWSTMLVLTFYLLGRAHVNCENRSESMTRGGRKMLKLFLCFVPSFVAAWVAITRSIDNWHHYADILAGSIIGAASSAVAYSYNYGSVFSWKDAGVPLEECHNRRKQALSTGNENSGHA